MTNKVKIISLIIVLLLAVSACSNAQSTIETSLDPVDEASGAFAPPGESDSRFDDTITEQEGNQDLLAGERIILMNASLSLQVDDATGKVNQIRALAVEMGGWVVSSSTSFSTNSAGDEVVYGNVTVRIPSERLYEAIDRIKDGVGRVVSENISGEDVTQDYVDTSSRLANLEATETQLQTIMDSAQTVEEVLAVQSELSRVRGEIEVARGRLQYYDEANAFSAISVYLAPPDAVFVRVGNWNPMETLESAFNTLLSVLRGGVDLLINLVVVILPLLILFGIPALWVWRRFGKRLTQRPPVVAHSKDS